MKKIILLLVISASLYTATANTSQAVLNNTYGSNSVFVTEIGSIDGIIDNIAVYPNPVVDELKISFKSSQSGHAGVALFNNIGKLVYKQESEIVPGNNIITIDIRSKSIEPGIYFVQIEADNQNFTRKLIVK